LLVEHRYNGTVTSLAAARDHLEGWAWSAALDAAHAAGPLAGAHEAERLDIIATASWWLGSMDASIDAREQAFAAFEEVGDERRAGQCAVWLWQDNVLKARPSIAGGWLRRARRLLDAHPGTVEYGELLLREAETAHGGGDLDAALATAQEALLLARALKARSMEAEALQTIGRVLIDQGDVAEGMGHLDEAMLSAVEGRLTPYATGKVYCSLISACENLGDIRRAAEWTDATLRWSEKHPLAMWPGICRVHHAALLTLRGQWDAAEREARRACDDIGEFHVGNAASGFAEIGDIRRRLGDLDGAEAAFGRAEELTGAHSPGLALLRLAQRRVDAATSIIANLLAEQSWNRLERGKLLPARVQIAVAAGDLDAASEAASELESIAADFDSPLLAAAALTARGRVLFASGDASAACATLRDALREWQGLDVPYEVATVRLLLGQACRACGDEDAATRSLQTAAAVFDRLGAALDVSYLRELESGSAPRPAGLTEREAEVLRLVADGKTNKDIAEGLFLSERTVARHLSNIFTKLGVNTRTAAAAFYYGRTS
jgi:DNA-binding CsgD family transcriptional regulator